MGGVWNYSARAGHLAEQGQGEDGITQIRQGLVCFSCYGIGDMASRSLLLALLAEVHGKAGQTEEGLGVR